MIPLNTDLSSILLQKTLNKHNIGLNNAIERLTTGWRINSAKDDVADYYISSGFQAKQSSMVKIIQNVDDGLDLLSTAEGALDNIYGMLSRLRDLAETAANGTYAEDSRNAMQAEADELVDQIGLVRETTEYNGINVFSKKKTLPATGGAATTATFSLSPPASSEPDSIESTSSPPMMMSSAPMMMSASPMMMSAEPVVASTTIDGAVEFSSGQTKTVTIDGVNYEVTNRQSTASSLSYSKDTTTGQITFLGDYFTIKAQTDVAHNLSINGFYNYIYGGDIDDTIELIGTSQGSYVYGGKGNDTITTNNAANVYIYGEDGDDTLTGTRYNTYIYGGAGNDTINGSSPSYGGGGNDIFNIYGGISSTICNGEDGDDIFNINSGTSVTVNGGSGTNTVNTDNGTNTKKVNVVGSNLQSVDFTGSETKTININGIDYTITNRTANDKAFIYDVSGDQITFYTEDFKITGDEDKAHNIVLSAKNMIFYGGNLADTIVSENYTSNIIVSKGGDDTIITKGGYVNIYSGDGNDKITTNGYNSSIMAGAGNDEVTYTGTNGYSNTFNLGDGDDTLTGASGFKNSVISGGSGTNTISGTPTNTIISGFDGATSDAESIEFQQGETKTVTINGINYTVKNNNTYADTNTFTYKYDPVTGMVSFGGNTFTITGQDGVEHNITVYGKNNNVHGGDKGDNIITYSYLDAIYGEGGNDNITAYASDGIVRGGDGDDILTMNTGKSVNGDAGNDKIIINSSSNLYTANGGDGDDIYDINQQINIIDADGDNTYYINADGLNISAGNGNDTFYVNGNNNTIKGGGGNDYIINDGNNNTIDGGVGDNLYIDNGTGSDYTNSQQDPNVGTLTFTAQDEQHSFEVNGVTYTATNNKSGTNTLSYSFNPNTGILTLESSDMTINTALDKSTVMNLRGDNNTINGSNLADRITIEQGTNNTINGNGGNDNLTTETENNSLNGGADNDSITINATTNKAITGGDGNDTINVASDNNTNIDSGIGDDRLNISGSNNTVDAGIGNDTIIASGNSNTITVGEGNNKLTITGNSNTLTAGGGNNTLGIGGDNNNVTVEKVQGTININGSGNTIAQTNGDNDVSIRGNGNSYTSTNGEKDISIIGNSNSITTTNGDDEFVIRGDSNIVETASGENKVDIKGSSNEYQGGDGIDSIKINGDTNILLGGDGDDSFLINKGASNIIDGQGSDKNTMINYGTGTTSTNIIDMTPDVFSCDLQVGLDSSDESVINIKIDFSMAGFDVDLSSTESARESLEAIDEALARLNKEHLNIGATMNRLESVRDAQMVQFGNITSSLSILRDADIASDTTELIRRQILQQASASLLLQTRNLRQESVLQLLNGLNAR